MKNIIRQTIKQWLKEEAEDETNYIDTDMLEEDNIDMLTLDGSFNFDKLIKMLYEKDRQNFKGSNGNRN